MKACIFIGYPTGQKGYKVYDLETKEIYISRDVVFVEEELPFKSNEPKETLSDKPITQVWEEDVQGNSQNITDNDALNKTVAPQEVEIQESALENTCRACWTCWC